MAVEIFAPNFRRHERIEKIERIEIKKSPDLSEDVICKTKKIMIVSLDNVKIFFSDLALSCFSNFKHYINIISISLAEKKNQLYSNMRPLPHKPIMPKKKVGLTKGFEVFVEKKNLQVARGFKAYKVVAAKFTEDEYQKISRCLNKFVSHGNYQGIIVSFKSFMLSKTVPEDVKSIIKAKIQLPQVSEPISEKPEESIWKKALLVAAFAIGVLAVSYGMLSILKVFESNADKPILPDQSFANESTPIKITPPIDLPANISVNTETSEQISMNGSVCSTIPKDPISDDWTMFFQSNLRKIRNSCDRIFDDFKQNFELTNITTNTGVLTTVEGSHKNKSSILGFCKNPAFEPAEEKSSAAPLCLELNPALNQTSSNFSIGSQSILDKMKRSFEKIFSSEQKNQEALIVLEMNTKDVTSETKPNLICEPIVLEFCPSNIKSNDSSAASKDS
ncbi:MAG: hypothetical protein WCT85_06830, partial [Parachlamydiales bacterium]